MSPDELLWTAPARGGLTPQEWLIVIDYLTARLESLLNRPIELAPDIYGLEERSTWFSADFASSKPLENPLGLQFRGTFGAEDIEGASGPYMAVRAWLYPYVLQHRVATTEDGHNHVFLRYVKADAGDDDWEMIGCTGEGDWRIFGWEPDVYGEFEGGDIWPDGTVA